MLVICPDMPNSEVVVTMFVCLLQALPISHQETIHDDILDPIYQLSKEECNQSMKGFSEYYSKIKDVNVTPDGILYLNDHVTIFRQFDDCFLGVDQIK